MTVKHILSFGSAELPEVKKKGPHISHSEDITLGVGITAQDLNPSLYQELSAMEFPYVLLLDLSGITQAADMGNGIRKTTEYLLPLLLDPAYAQNLSEKIIFLSEDSSDDLVLTALTDNLREYGLHNIKIIRYKAGKALPGASHFSSINALTLPPVNEYMILGDNQWSIIHTTTGRINADHVLLSEKIRNYKSSDINIAKQDQYAHSQEENRQLKDKIAVLTKNLHDLNNYYRYVRGETTFKHHNRDEKKEDKPPTEQKEPIQPGLFLSDQSDKGKYQEYYNSVYEKMPGVYKKMAVIIKIVSGRRELLYYLSKKHKRAFLDFVRALPEVKQIQIWYYYEYEILPGWYKKVGKFLAKR